MGPGSEQTHPSTVQPSKPETQPPRYPVTCHFSTGFSGSWWYQSTKWDNCMHTLPPGFSNFFFLPSSTWTTFLMTRGLRGPLPCAKSELCQHQDLTQNFLSIQITDNSNQRTTYWTFFLLFYISYASSEPKPQELGPSSLNSVVHFWVRDCSTTAIPYCKWPCGHPGIKKSSPATLLSFLFTNHMSQWVRVLVVDPPFLTPNAVFPPLFWAYLNVSLMLTTQS